MDLQGRGAVVTGGASGIGAAVMRALGEAGARPVAWDLAGPDGEEAITCDVTDPDSVVRAMRATEAQIGVPSVLVASAGIGGFAELCDVSLDDFRHILDVNLNGALLCLQQVARALRATGSEGSIVCISSVNARLADRGMGAYCCSKAALDMLVRVAAVELGPDGIRVNAIAPGITDTPLFSKSAGRIPGFIEALTARTPLGRLGTADEVADAVLAVLRTDWVTGQSIVADGGLSLHSPIDPSGQL